MPSFSPLSRRSTFRLVVDLAADELSRNRGRSASSLGARTWRESTRLDGPELDLDSLDRLNLAGAVNEFFHLHEHGTEDRLLNLPRLGDWCDLVEEALAAAGTCLTFRTSGSTGEPKRCTHAIADLQREALGWAERLTGTAAILSTVPAHHIYGTIFTALLPDRIGPGCQVMSGAGAEAVRQAAPGTLVVATPMHWQYLASALPTFPVGVTGVSSTAPMAASLAGRLRDQRLERLVQIYGSSETAGIAAREHEDAAYELLDDWTRAGEEAIESVLAEGSRRVITPPDHVRWIDDRRFHVAGRRDGAVQVGGYNVFPARVRDTLLAHADVAQASVRLGAGTGRLKAFVVPATPVADEDRFAAELDRWCGDRLTTSERPRHFTFGAALPVTAMGKAADW